ncbi:amidohydrolase family protein [Roseococcus sp.]|uniref:amidohydrolase family protein n=1 Tax=Roseococcus sp. TaxID=2109646 RepID=UPI003BAD5083
MRQEWLNATHEPILDAQLPIIDPHHHIWHRPHERYTPEDLRDDLRDGHNITDTVFVQCRSMYRADGPSALRPVGETEFVNAVADAAVAHGGPRIAAGIVSMADLVLGDDVRPVLEAHLAAAPQRLRGIRNMTTSHPEIVSSFGRIPPQRLLDPVFQRGFSHLAPLGLSYDVWAYHTQLDEVRQLAASFPQTSIILDHIGGPLGMGLFRSQRDTVFAEWSAAIRALAACPNVTVKLGGFGMHLLGFDFHKESTAPDSQTLASAIRPYVDTCIEAFGAERCMFESNFPVDKGMFSYRVMWNAFKRLTAGATAAERSALFSGTAARVYRLPQ